MANKLKVLAYSDGPTTTTGFGRVAREVLKSVHSTGKYDITSIGINYFGITPEKPSEDSSSSDKDIYNAYVNYQLIPASAGKGTDPYGRRLFLEALEKSDFDIVWILQDLFNLTDITPSIIELKKKKKFKVILYFPIDTQYVHDYFLDATKMADAVVVYNKWTNKLLTSMRGDELKDRLCTIYHGYNPEDFFPLNSKEMEAERKRIFGNKVTMDDILIVRSDSNQQRKDWFKTLQIVGGVAKSNKRVKFYANTTVNNYDFPLFDLAKRVGLTPGENFIYQSEFTKTNNLTQKDLNVLYNVADLGISTSRGEGCGLFHYEMMAIGKNILISHNSAHEEAIEAEAAIPLYCGKISTDPTQEFDSDYLDVLPNDLGMQRPVCSVRSGIESLKSFCNDFDRNSSLNMKGFAFMKKLTWGKVGLQWIDLFDKVAKQKEPYIHEEKVSHSILQEYVARVQNSMDDLNRKWKQEFGIEPPSLNFTGEENEKKKNNIIIP